MSDVQAPLQLNHGKIEQAMMIAIKAIGQQEFNVPDVVFGLAEAIGRTIQAQDINPMAKAQLAGYVAQHLLATVKAGLEASGHGNLVTGVQ